MAPDLSNDRRPRRAWAPAAGAVALAGLLAVAVDASGAVLPTAHHTEKAALVVYAYGSQRSIEPGGRVVFTVRVSRRAELVEQRGSGKRPLPALISLRVVRPLPAGIFATFDEASTRTTQARLTIATRLSTRPGSYRVHLIARGRRGSGPDRPMRSAETVVTVIVAARSEVGISAVTSGQLAPGRTLPIELELTNTRASELVLAHIAVRIARIDAPSADATHPCTAADFAIVQTDSAFFVRVPAGSSRSLSALGVPPDRWPSLAMLDRPVNQDGCELASVTLEFSAVTTEAGS